LGFNTVEHTNPNGEVMHQYNYFLNDKRFSKMQIIYNFENGFDSDPLFIEKKGTVPYDKSRKGVLVDHFVESSGLISLEMEEGYSFMGDRELFRVTNGKLVYVELGDYISKNIEYTDKGITVTMEERSSYRGSSAKRVFLVQLCSPFLPTLNELQEQNTRAIITNINFFISTIPPLFFFF
jgi:hypothetical protein